MSTPALDNRAPVEPFITAARVLSLIHRQEKLELILDELARWVESQVPSARCLIQPVGGSTAGIPGPGIPGLTQECLNQVIESGTGERPGRLLLHFAKSDPNLGEYRAIAAFAAGIASLAIAQQRLLTGLEFQAQHDSLTGLLNRRSFQERLETAIRSAWVRSTKVTVLFLGLDRFKQVNDIYGNAVGDQLLAAVGLRLQAALGENELAARVGGDEFALLLCTPGNQQESEQAAHRILEFLRAPHFVNGQELGITASCGVSLFPDHALAASELLRAADTAMSQVKRHGRNDVLLFAPGNRPQVSDRLHLEHGLGLALGKDEFQLVYQPLVTMAGKLDGLEALLSWNHPQRGRIAPKDFIPVAEESGLIVPIGTWVLREACQQGARWMNAGHLDLSVSVNVSALQFERVDFVDTVAAALSASRFPAERLELEVTESFVIRDVEAAALRMAALRKLGIRIAIDDFGTGYSSLSYLSRLPVDSLKIDQSFVRTIQDPSGSLPVVQTIVRLAHNLNLSVVAEGVETTQELDLLRVVGCDKVQGYLYGYGLTEQDVEALLNRPGGMVAIPVAHPRP
jgi:diguanylate cyclase (GGDEF)-like protein